MKPRSIEFITGVMNSGKSYDLLERIEEAEDRKMSYLILKPALDTRDGAFVKSRKTDKTYPATSVDEADITATESVLDLAKKVEVVFIDEVQFFSESFVERLIISTFHDGIAIVASGLTKDFKGEVFPASEFLKTYATLPIEFRKATCYCCGSEDAEIDVRMDSTDKVITEGDSVSVEGADTSYHYETVCKKCYKKKGGK